MSGGIFLHGITMRYGANAALDDVSLEVPEGQIHAVIGPNGAGKSTLFGVVAGEHSPHAGRVMLGDRDITHLTGHARAKLGIARAFQVARIFSSLTVAENIRVSVLQSEGLGGVFWGSPRKRLVEERVHRILERVDLGDLAQKPANTLAQGDRKRLEIAMAIAQKPKVLLLDEPTAGMSAAETRNTVSLVQALWQAEGITVILTEHDMDVVFALAKHVTVLAQGRILCTGEPAEIRSRPDVVRVYLGDHHE